MVVPDQCKILATALIDSGCTHSVIDSNFVKACQLETDPLTYKVRMSNADGSENKNGKIKSTVTLTMNIGE